MKRKLQVFVSSTYKDLIPERQAAVSAILKAGHIPAGMELFTAGDRSQMTTIKEWIDESDVYMLILGGRYGSIEPTSALSYTELEYDYALQQGKPVFAVVITEPALEAKLKAGGSSFIEKENSKELSLFRSKVLRNISSFFEDPKDIKLCVHESLADFASKRELKGWVSADEVVDTKPLFEEIKKLSEENKSLKETLATLESRKEKGTVVQKESKAEQFKQIESVLRAIEVKIPAKLSNGTESTQDLLNLFYYNKEVLINGVTNGYNANEAETFFYTNVCPKLQVHGLTLNEKVAGVHYRRSSVTPFGHEFLADIEKRIYIKNSPQKSAQASNGQVKPVEPESTQFPKKLVKRDSAKK